MPAEEYEYEDVRYGISNPIAKKLHSNFDRVLEHNIKSTNAGKTLDVGCGEGFIIKQIIEILKPDIIIGGDISDYWLERAKNNLSEMAGLLLLNVEVMPFPDSFFSLVTCIEVLEHVDNPEAALREIARITAEWAIISVPNRYLWRLGNLLRGKYLGNAGNTPGHINEWTVSQFRSFIDPYFDIVSQHTPFPWQILLLRKKNPPVL